MPIDGEVEVTFDLFKSRAGEALLIAPNREGAKKLNSSVARRTSDLKVRSKR